MDKYEYKVRADEIKELIAKGDYAQAAEIADTIDWRRVKSIMMLCTISDLYKINRRYEDAKNMLLLAYERRPGGKTICYSLCELCIKTEEFVQAVNYYKEFVQVAPRDSGRYILQYKLYEAQDVSLEERIGVLEELKKKDYREKWAYELAYLYHRVGLATRCVEECDELILWFGEGKYVVKAMELKMLHEPLTPAQQEKYNQRFDNAGAVQEKAPEVEALSTEADWEAAVEEEKEQTSAVAEQEVQPEALQETEEPDIQVKTMDVGRYNTINLQAELAAGLQEVLSEGTPQSDAITRSILAPLMDSDTEGLDLPEIDEVDESDIEPEAEVMEASEVFFGETGDLGSLQEGIAASEQTAETESEEKVSDSTAEIVMSQLRMESVGRAEEQVLTAQPPKEIAGVLSQESDGQLRLVVPVHEEVEKQITGQMNIEEILVEWERMKKVNEEKRKEEVRQHVLQQTGTMFTEFEASVRDGLLEQLESGKEIDVDEAALEELEGTDEYGEAEEIAEVEETFAESGAEETDEDAAVELEMDETAEETGEVDEAAETESDETDEYGEVEEIAEVEETFAESEGEETAEEAAVESETEETDEETGDVDEAAETESDKTDEYGEAEEIAEVEETFAEPETEETAEEAAVESEIDEADEPEIDEASVESETEETDEETGEVDEAAETEPESDEPARQEQHTAPVRETARVRAMTKEEKELYAPFIQSRTGREKLIRAIDNISMAAYTGNIIITGEEGMDTLALAKNMIREVQMTDSNFSGKVAKISGQGINSKNVEETLERLKNGGLIIQKVSDMNAETVEALHRVLQKESIGIIVIIEDTKKAMSKFLSAYPQLKEIFTARVDLEAMSSETLVNYARQYAREMEYSIDEMGVLALHTRIEELQTVDHVVTVVEVKEIMDEAIRHANRKTLRHFFDILLAKRYDDEDMIILTERDFV